MLAFELGTGILMCGSCFEDCGAGRMRDDPYPEVEDVRSSRIEDCEPMRMASLHFLDASKTV